MVDANTYYINKHLEEVDKQVELENFKQDLIDELVAGNDIDVEPSDFHYIQITFEEVIEHMFETVHITELAPIMRDLAKGQAMGARSNELERWIIHCATELVEGEL